MVKHLDDDSVESVKKFLLESLEETRSGFSVKKNDEYSPIEEYSKIRDFLQSLVDELTKAVENNQEIPMLNSFLDTLSKEINKDEILKENFFDKIKKIYKSTENSKLKGLFPTLAVLAADSISPEVGQFTQALISMAREK